MLFGWDLYLQQEVYEKVMNPLVLDFMGGKNSLLVAMGPTGSGKTHTMFGCPRDPGMLPLALRQIFSNATGNGGPHSSRYFFGTHNCKHLLLMVALFLIFLLNSLF